MKNKSGHHKATNRFKFVTFADRVNSIDIRRSALYRLEHVNIDEPEENETYFHNTLVRWKVLNLTNEYINFTKRYENIVTLPQLLHIKDDIIDYILEELSKQNVLNLQPFLELVVALARDLQEDFYQHFPKLLESLIKLLNTKDPEQLEWTFICLAFLFKHLRAYLKRDITIVIKSVLPLLSENTKWYIRNFAAESFAFVARDVKDKKKFLETVVKAIQSNEDAVAGCGHLLFEVIRGISGQFHSSASTFFPLFFSTLRNSSASNQKVLFNILTQTVGDMLDIIEPRHSKPFWDSIIIGVQQFFDVTTIDGKSYWKMTQENPALEYILMLIGQCLEYKSGKFLIEPLSLLDMINNLIDADLNESNTKITSQIAILLLMCSHINLPHLNAVYFVKKVLSIQYSDIVTNFVQEVVSCSSFDIIIFPHFIEAVKFIDSGVVSALSKICLKKSPLCKNGSDLYSWVKYPIDLGSKTTLFNDYFIKTFNEDSTIDNKINLMICLPHIKHLNLNEIQPIFKSSITKLLSELKGFKDKELVVEIRNLLYLMAIIIESSVHMMNSESLKEVFDINDIIDTLVTYASDCRYICSLRIIDLILTMKESEHSLESDTLFKIYPSIEDNLLSPFHEMRLITTHICSLFEIVLPVNMEPPFKRRKLIQIENEHNSYSNNKKESFKVFSLCYNAENIPLSVEGYREQLLKLSKTIHDSVQYKLIENLPFKNFSLKYMLGFLNSNFKLLWDPLQNLILTFANGLPANEFWEIFHPCLIKAAINVKEHKDELSCDEYLGSSEFLKSVFKEYFDISDKPDYNLYRIHLWEMLCQSSNLSETKNRDITTLFLEFLKTEYETPHYTTTCNKLNDENEDKIDEDEEENDKIAVSKSTYDTLIVHMKVYSNIQNPKSLYKEKELKNIYYDFLMHKNPILQKIALDCLMRYKNKHWTPYKDQLYNLVDGKKFKEELRSFKLNSDSEIIKDEDREELMPIVLRIAFSKMITNTGIDKKGGSQMRRSLVMRFISGCKESELIIFIEMAFKNFSEYINLDLDEMHKRLLSNLQQIGNMSPKKLLGCINLVESMREQFIKPGEMSLLPKLMKIIFCIGTFVNETIPVHENQGYVSILKNIRSNCISSLGNFFKQFEEWNWKEDEILYIYNNFIWPIVNKLAIEGIHSPTPLLKLFNIWSQYPRLHNLFRVYNQEDKTTPIYHILSLLANNKLHHSVYEVCMCIIERFLTLESEDLIQLSEQHLIQLKNDEILSKLNLTENLNIGSWILLHNASQLVTILKSKFENVNPKKMQKRDVIIISRVTEIVYESESVDKLLKFSLPILIQKIGNCGTDDDFTTCIEALTKLLNKSSNPKSHIKTIIPLFGKVNTGLARKHLCKSLDVLSNNCDIKTKEKMIVTSEIIAEMNASDEKWIDQPDFERRLNVYKRIYKMVDDNEVDYELGSLIVQNCFYTIANTNDISLRSNASSCLQRILPKLLIQHHKNDFFVNETILNLIKNGLKSDNENLKLDTILLFGELVRESHEFVPMFKELHPLSNKSNKEIDFFENLQHLQVHRKIRAFLKFNNYVKTSKNVPSSKTLTQFILPLASQYICNEKFVEKYSLVEAAIDTIATICRLLPWHQYEGILRLYLSKLQHSTDHQKQLIKILSLILDSFHFDLSKANNVEELMALALHKKDTDDTDEKKDPENKKMEVEESYQLNESKTLNTTQEVQDVIPYERIQVLSPSAAKRVIFVVTCEILVQLNWNSTQVTEHEASHKSLRKDNSLKRETEDKLRIPMGFAIVKLLQKLPQPMLKNNILGILIKVCNYLKSPLVNIRASARDILSKIMIEIGSEYFDMLLSHLTTLLTKGFQVHVLIVSVHMLLEALQNQFKPQQMDNFLDNILKVCFNDLFGHASEEKEVVKLGNKAPEAKPSKKCFLTLRIIAQKISDSSIIRLLTPFKNIIESTNSKRIVLKIEGCFQYISLGLVENPNISIESILKFLCGLLSDSIQKLSNKKKVYEPEIITLEDKKPKKEDCFLILPDPKGSKKMPKSQSARTSSQANAHIITEFGLNMLHVVLQKENTNVIDCRPYLDPMVPFIIEALKSNQVRVSTLALKCLNSIWNKKMSLPTLKNKIEVAVEAIFDILHKYATSGLSKKDENFHLVSNSFKAISTLIRSVNYYTMTIEQLKTLIMYAEHDILDYEKQATAFSLLKTVIGAKYNLAEIKSIISKVSTITITDESPRAREESAQVILLYLMNYPSEKQIRQYIEFYVSQMEYELDHGRIAAVKIIQSMIDSFTEEIVNKNASFVFISLGMRLVMETNSECRNIILKSIEKLVLKMNAAKRNELFNLVMVLMSDNKAVHVEISAYLSSIFVAIEKESFMDRIDEILPKISEKLHGSNPNVGRFVKANKSVDNSEINSENKDNSYIQLLKLLQVLCENCKKILSNDKYESTFDEIGINCQNLLAYSHAQVRLYSAKYLVQYMRSLDGELVYNSITNKTDSQRYFVHTVDSIKSLVLDLVSQLIPGEVSEELANAVCENISTILLIIEKFPKRMFAKNEDNEDYIDEIWIIKKIRSALNSEVVKTPGVTVVRFAIFNMLEELTTNLSKSTLAKITMILVSSLVREITKTDTKFDNIKNKAISVNTALNNMLGNDTYNEIVSKAQAKLMHKRNERKIKLAQDKVNNPEKAAKRKLVIKDKKREYKKRKLDKMKGRSFKSRKVSMDQIDFD